MKFTLRSLGRLREATIDLGKDLIVLTGPNNTSKTYVAHTMYGFFRKLLPELHESIQNHLVVRASSSDSFEIDIHASVNKLEEIIAGICVEYQRRLARVLACESSFVESTRVLISLTQDELNNATQQILNWGADESQVRRGRTIEWTKRSTEGTLHFRRIADKPQVAVHDDEQNDADIRAVASVIVSAMLMVPLFGVLGDPQIFVAERAAIQLFSKELSQRKTEIVYELLDARAEHRPDANLLEKRAKRYSLPIRDALESAQDLAAIKRERSEFAPFADELEQQLLEGIVRVSDDGEMSFQPAGMKGNLEMHLSSSSVKALAPLVFYLRHVARKGHFLIIDEPELNLHPDNQRKVARLLGRLARNGIKVLISTHSDYVIREINNLIMLDADVQGDLRRKYGYRDDETLSPSSVGAYIFDATMAREIQVKPTGIEVETIDREINRLNQVSQDLFFSLFPDAS